MKRSQNTKETLLRSATEVFVEKGFSGARVDDIARRASANKAMIYYHFCSKQGLYKAVLLRHIGGLHEEMGRAARPETQPLRRLTAFYGSLGRMFQERPSLPYMMLREILAGGIHMDEEVARELQGVLAFVRATVEEGVAHGSLRPVNPLFVHLSVIAPLIIFCVSRPFRERLLPGATPSSRSVDPQAFLAHLGDLLERILTPAPAESVTKEVR